MAGLDPALPHVLRRTMPTLAFLGGAKLERVQAHLRHHNANTTIRYYREFKSLRNDAARRIRF